MVSMRCVQKAAALLLPALASTFVIPFDEVLDQVFANPTLNGNPTVGANPTDADKIIDFQPEKGLAKFNVPCPECSDEERGAFERAVFTLNIPGTQEACLGESGVLYLGDGSTRHGHQSFGLHIEDESILRESQALWSVSCVCLDTEPGGECKLEDYARVLVFNFRTIGEYPHPGFTATYKQFNKPEILTISLFPDDEALFDLLKSKHWHNPSNPTALNVPSLAGTIIQSTLFEQSFASPTGSSPSIPLSTGVVAAGSSATATVTASPSVASVRELYRIFESASVISSFEPTATQGLHLNVQVIQPTNFVGHVFEAVEAKAKGLLQAVIDARPHLPPSVESPAMSSAQVASNVQESVLMQHDELDEADNVVTKYPIPVDTITHPLDNNDLATEPTLASMSIKATASPMITPHAPTLRTDQATRAFQITSLIIILVSLFTAIFVFLFRNPRRRADRAAQREERRRRAQYRRAARQHKWRTWFGRLRGSGKLHRTEPVPETWEEKQLAAIKNGTVSLHGVRDELRALRTAHTVVDGIVRAEEGRTEGNVSTSRIRRFERRFRSLSGSTADGIGPPTYEESVTIINGYQYTPDGTDITPDSSVIDTSPRTSIYMRDSDSEKE